MVALRFESALTTKLITMRVKIENTYLDVEYYFADDEVSLECMRIEYVFTEHDDDITDLMYHYNEKIVEQIYNKLTSYGYIL
jgi:hypothetical protein